MNGIKTLILATTNKGKLKELQKMLAGLPIEVKCLDDFGPQDHFEETGATFEENARLKALHYSRKLNGCVLADDSGLQVDALNLAPGVYSARYAGVDGLQCDQANNRKLLETLKDIPAGKRTARFRCCLCLAEPAKVLLEVDGQVEGVIGYEPRGSNGFGYDPLFFIPAEGKTVAELPDERKNAVSHRGQAFARLAQRLKELC